MRNQEQSGLTLNLAQNVIPNSYRRRGFLPDQDPATRFPVDSELARLDELGGDLPVSPNFSAIHPLLRAGGLPGCR